MMQTRVGVREDHAVRNAVHFFGPNQTDPFLANAKTRPGRSAPSAKRPRVRNIHCRIDMENGGGGTGVD